MLMSYANMGFLPGMYPSIPSSFQSPLQIANYMNMVPGTQNLYHQNLNLLYPPSSAYLGPSIVNPNTSSFIP